MLKAICFETSPQGWKSNKYKCRRCNIAFVWNTPNNPLDIIPYVEKFIKDTEEKIASLNDSDQSLEPTIHGLEAMKANLTKLNLLAEASDLDMKDLEEYEQQMADMVHKFKKHLMIEKIKMGNRICVFQIIILQAHTTLKLAPVFAINNNPLLYEFSALK